MKFKVIVLTAILFTLFYISSIYAQDELEVNDTAYRALLNGRKRIFYKTCSILCVANQGMSIPNTPDKRRRRVSLLTKNLLYFSCNGSEIARS